MTIRPDTAPAPRWRRRPANALPLLAPIGAAGFTATWAVLGALSPGYQMWDIVVSSYSPISQPVSGLGLGETAVAMNGAFVVFGVLVASGAWASARSWPRTGSPRRRGWARALVALSGVGMIVSGLFTLESVMLHFLGFLLGIGAPAVGFVLAALVLRDADRPLSRALLVAGPAALALMALFLATFDAEAAGDGEGVAGLVQRILITLVLATIAVLGWRATRAPSAGPPAGRGSVPGRVLGAADVPARARSARPRVAAYEQPSNAQAAARLQDR